MKKNQIAKSSEETLENCFELCYVVNNICYYKYYYKSNDKLNNSEIPGIEVLHDEKVYSIPSFGDDVYKVLYKINLTRVFEYFNTLDLDCFNNHNVALDNLIKVIFLGIDKSYRDKDSEIQFKDWVTYYLDLFFSIQDFKKLYKLLLKAIGWIGLSEVSNPYPRRDNPEDSFIMLILDVVGGLMEYSKGGFPLFNYNIDIIKYYSLKVLEPKDSKEYLIHLLEQVNLMDSSESPSRNSLIEEIHHLLTNIELVEKYKQEQFHFLLTNIDLDEKYKQEQFHFFKKKGDFYYRLETTKLIDIAKSLSIIQASNSQSIVTRMENSKRFMDINFDSLKTQIKTIESNNRDQNTSLTNELKSILKEIGVLV